MNGNEQGMGDHRASRCGLVLVAGRVDPAGAGRLALIPLEARREHPPAARAGSGAVGPRDGPPRALDPERDWLDAHSPGGDTRGRAAAIQPEHPPQNRGPSWGQQGRHHGEGSESCGGPRRRDPENRHAGCDASEAGRGHPGSPVHPRPPAKPPPSVGERGGRGGARDLHAARAPGAPRSGDFADWLSADDGDDESAGRSRGAYQPVPAHAIHHQRQFRRGRGLGLFLIGVPYAVIWGSLAAALRFIPYLGAFVAMLLPLALSLAVFPGWLQPALVVSLFLVLEPITGSVIESLFYSQSAGVSQVALLVALTFWTWLWGPAGLLMATPLTVCLVVLGKHLPSLGFIVVLMGDRPVIEAK